MPRPMGHNIIFTLFTLPFVKRNRQSHYLILCVNGPLTLIFFNIAETDKEQQMVSL